MLITRIRRLSLSDHPQLLNITQKETDKVNEITRDLLSTVKTEAQTIASVAMPELKAYGESVRKFVFRGNDDGQQQRSDSLDHIQNNLENIQNDLKALSGESDISIVQKQIGELEKRFNKSQGEVIKELRSNESKINLDLTDIGLGIIQTPYSDFPSVQRLLDNIFLSFLSHNGFQAYTYNRSWILWNEDTAESLESPGNHDSRPLSDAGIYPGIKLKVVKMHQKSL